MEHPLKRHREGLGLSQKGLADKLGCSQSMVSHIEKGVRKADPRQAIEWEQKTGIPKGAFCPDVWPAEAAA